LNLTEPSVLLQYITLKDCFPKLSITDSKAFSGQLKALEVVPS